MFQKCKNLLLLQAEGMINEIRTAFKEALDNLSWMDEQTRQAAKDKVREHKLAAPKKLQSSLRSGLHDIKQNRKYLSCYPALSFSISFGSSGLFRAILIFGFAY